MERYWQQDSRRVLWTTTLLDYWIYAAHSEVHRTWKTGRYAIRNINTRWGRPEGSQGGLVQTSINTSLVVGLHFAACAGSQADRALLISPLWPEENNASFGRRSGNLGHINMYSHLILILILIVMHNWKIELMIEFWCMFLWMYVAIKIDAKFFS